MSIQSAILGILSWRPSTGYELKKIFEDSTFMYWSGNNNQIYKAMLQLEKDGLVTCNIVHQESSPSKKIYSITEEGLEELKLWLKSTVDAPEIKKTFLIQLAWSDLLDNEELKVMLDKYEHEIKVQLLMQKEKFRRGLNTPGRSPREILLWEAIHENIISSYDNELHWIDETRIQLFGNEIKENASNMNYQIIEKENKKYIEITSTSQPFYKEDDAIDLIALCWEHEANALMLHNSVLSEDFYNLRTKVAGNMIQKFINYGIKAAAIIPQEVMNKGRFREMALETNKGNHFRLYDNKEEAEMWLLR